MWKTRPKLIQIEISVARCAPEFQWQAQASATTLDDLLSKVFPAILKSKVKLTATKGANTELSGVCLELSQPRARHRDGPA